MGTSNWQNISFCCETIYRCSPRRILDVGIGSLGRWALLTREFTDIWEGRVFPDQWKCTIDGIEAFEKQIYEFHYHLYDHIFVGDAFEVIDRLDFYDMIILGDVIEHFSEERGRAMLKKCMQRCNAVLLSTPVGQLEDWPQDDIYGNEWEVHRYVYEKNDFLCSNDWSVFEYRLFQDYFGREFGTFLLIPPMRIDSPYCR